MSPVFGTIGLAPTGMRCAEGEQVHQATIYVRHLVEGNIPSRGPDKTTLSLKLNFGVGSITYQELRTELAIGCVRTRGVVTRAGRSTIAGGGRDPKSVEF